MLAESPGGQFFLRASAGALCGFVLWRFMFCFAANWVCFLCAASGLYYSIEGMQVTATDVAFKSTFGFAGWECPFLQEIGVIP